LEAAASGTKTFERNASNGENARRVVNVRFDASQLALRGPRARCANRGPHQKLLPRRENCPPLFDEVTRVGGAAQPAAFSGLVILRRKRRASDDVRHEARQWNGRSGRKPGSPIGWVRACTRRRIGQAGCGSIATHCEGRSCRD
jgi:hypothetical protein